MKNNELPDALSRQPGDEVFVKDPAEAEAKSRRVEVLGLPQCRRITPTCICETKTDNT
jgi:hypothetical protein